MKQAAGLVVALGLGFLGCGGGDDGGSGFSKEYAHEIAQDCSESVKCYLQNDKQLEDDPFNECIKDSSDKLNSDPAAQEKFLTSFGRCKQFIVCDYYTCASSGATGYGESQALRVRQRCQAESDCRGMTGNPDADPANAVNSCTWSRTGELEPLNAQQRQAWETTFLRCSMLSACDFVNCSGQ